jgi:endonuclease YncB( thermonuclease family)
MATDISVTDGDTIKCDVQLNFGVVLDDQDFRLHGINAYETTKRGDWDKGLKETEIKRLIELGKKATVRVEEVVENAKTVSIEVIVDKEGQADKGKYGRWLAVIWIDGSINLNELLVKEGLAVKAEY